MSTPVHGSTVVGEFLPITPHNTQATSSAMRFWARVIGDRNPRYVNDSDLRTESDGPFEAHPCWLYSVHDTGGVGTADLVPVLAGTNWVFNRPVRLGDKIQPYARLIDEYTTVGKHAGETLVQVVETTYENELGDRYATARSTFFCLDPARAKATTKYANWTRTRYTDSQLEEIEACYDDEVRRPNAIRYIEDVAIGDNLPPIVRGPVTSEEMTLFVGATCPVPGVELFTQARLKGETAGFVHPRSSTYETYTAGCVDDATAQELGFPAAHDLGMDRISYTASLACSWMGPRGLLRKFDFQLHKPVMLGDTSWCRGRVTSVQPNRDDNRGTVVLELVTENQHGSVTGRGIAEVTLDARGGST